ncbi:MAG: acyltransferase [Rhizobacter sp.]|nr:acyltransferase [Rhizobacter sp.]
MSETTSPALPNPEHVPWLDGLRGIAALWVFVAHVQILSGLRYIPIVSWGGLAVDLFMMLSGFLMAHHYLLRQRREPWDAPSTWGHFWTRRFFRIAPLYYLLLVVALALGPWMGAHRDAVAAAWPHTATSAARYGDQSLGNLLAHASFVFGMLPDYAFRTALPDWSIGLEMQFYLVFPLLMLAVARFGGLATGAVVIVVCAWMRWQWPGWFQRFEMPAFLPLKLYVFFIGMGIALSRARGRMAPALLASLVVAAGYAMAERHSEALARLPLVAALFYLMDDGSLPGSARVAALVARVRAVLSMRLSRFLGDTAYGYYLVHLLVLLPVAGLLAGQPAYVQWPAGLRWLVCAAVAAPVAYAIAWVLYRTVEQPGIQLGKALLKRRPVVAA